MGILPMHTAMTPMHRGRWPCYVRRPADMAICDGTYISGHQQGAKKSLLVRRSMAGDALISMNSRLIEPRYSAQSGLFHHHATCLEKSFMTAS